MTYTFRKQLLSYNHNLRKSQKSNQKRIYINKVEDVSESSKR